MIVAELMEQLEGMDPEAAVLIATQPSYPIAHELSFTTTAEGAMRHDGSDDEPGVVWLAAGESVGYAPADIYGR